MKHFTRLSFLGPSLILAVALWLGGCREAPPTPEELRKELMQLGLPFTTHDFLRSVNEQDELAVKLFLDAGMDVNARDDSGFSALLVAATKGNSNLVATFLERDADPNVRLKTGESPLYLAIFSHHPQIARLLLERGADPEAMADHRLRPLHIAVVQGETAVIQQLLARKVDINAPAESSLTPLMMAISQERETIVSLLLDAGAKLDLRDDEGETALMKAVRTDQESVVDLMIQRGADVNAKDASEHAVLDHAFLGGNIRQIQRLIASGARSEHYVKVLIDQRVKEIASEATGAFPHSGGGSLNPTKALILQSLREWSTNVLFTIEIRQQAVQQIVEALKDALHLHRIIRIRSAEAADHNVEVDYAFVQLMEEVLPGSTEGVAEQIAKLRQPPTPEEAVDLWRPYDQAFIEAVKERWQSLLLDGNVPYGFDAQIQVTFNLLPQGAVADFIATGEVIEEAKILACRAIKGPAPYAKWPADLKRRLKADKRSLTLILNLNGKVTSASAIPSVKDG